MTDHNLFTTAFLLFSAVPVGVQGQTAAAIEQTKPTPSTKSRDGITTEAIQTTPLSTSQPDAVGILTSEQTSIPQNFRGNSDPTVIARLIKPYFDFTLPEITALWQRIAIQVLLYPAGPV